MNGKDKNHPKGNAGTLGTVAASPRESLTKGQRRNWTVGDRIKAKTERAQDPDTRVGYAKSKQTASIYAIMTEGDHALKQLQDNQLDRYPKTALPLMLEMREIIGKLNKTVAVCSYVVKQNQLQHLRKKDPEATVKPYFAPEGFETPTEEEIIALLAQLQTKHKISL